MEPDSVSDRRIAVENLQTWAIAIVSALPVLGGPLSVLMTEYLPASRIARLEEMLRAVSDQVALADAAMEDRVLSDDFAELYERAVVGGVRSAAYEKRRAYAALVSNGILNHDIAHEERMYFVDLLDRCRPVHLAVLGIMARTWPDDGRTLGDVLPDSGELATLASVDLFNWQLTHTDHTAYPHWKLSEFAHGGLTDLGRRFERFITLASEVDLEAAPSWVPAERPAPRVSDQTSRRVGDGFGSPP